MLLRKVLFRKIAEMRTRCLTADRTIMRIASRQGEAIAVPIAFLLARDHQALAGHDYPAAVLTADGVDPAEAGDGIAGIDFVNSLPAFDQRATIGDIAQHPTYDRRQPAEFGFRRSAGPCRWRACRRRNRSPALPRPH